MIIVSRKRLFCINGVISILYAVFEKMGLYFTAVHYIFYPSFHPSAPPYSNHRLLLDYAG